MNLKKVVYFFLGILIIGSMFIPHILMEKAEVRFSSWGSIMPLYELSEPVYIWNKLEYDGLLVPTVEDALFVTKEEDTIPIVDSPVEAYLIEGQQGGILGESDMKSDLDRVPLSGYKLNKNQMHIVFRIDEESDKEFLKNINGFLVNYKVLGVDKSVTLELVLVK